MKNPFAFPCSAHGETGMTLRDWFAGEVLKHIWISATQNAEEEEYNLNIARACYRMADTMLKARAE